MIVVDTDLLAYLHVEDQRTAQAEAVLRRDSEWVAPILWRSEFRSTLAGLVRRRALTLEDALRIVAEAERGMAAREYAVASRQVLLLAEQSGCPAYDCEFVSLAQDLAIRLVTADRHVLVLPFRPSRSLPERSRLEANRWDRSDEPSGHGLTR